MSQVMTAVEARPSRLAIPWWLGWVLATAMVPVLLWLGFQHMQLSEHRERSFGWSAGRIANGLFWADRLLQEAVHGAEAGDVQVVASRLLQARIYTDWIITGVENYDFLLGEGRATGLHFLLAFYHNEVGDLRMRVERTGVVSAEDAQLLRDLQHDLTDLHDRLSMDVLMHIDTTLIGERMRDFGEVARTPSVRQYYQRTNPGSRS